MSCELKARPRRGFLVYNGERRICGKGNDSGFTLGRNFCIKKSPTVSQSGASRKRFFGIYLKVNIKLRGLLAMSQRTKAKALCHN